MVILASHGSQSRNCPQWRHVSCHLRPCPSTQADAISQVLAVGHPGPRSNRCKRGRHQGVHSPDGGGPKFLAFPLDMFRWSRLRSQYVLVFASCPSRRLCADIGQSCTCCSSPGRACSIGRRSCTISSTYLSWRPCAYDALSIWSEADDCRLPPVVCEFSHPFSG